MIKDTLANYPDYCADGSLLAKGFEFIRTGYSPDMKPGRVEIDGDRVFALVQGYTSAPSKDKRFESHRLYIDIQYVARGREIAEYLPATELAVAEDQTPKADVIYYHDAEGTDIVLNEGEFAVFFPQDGHKPGVICGTPREIKKVVVKVLKT
jgi:YhcH/YjgK/YiaL family protein